MTDTPQDPIAAARQDHRTYMQQYRAAGRDLSTKAHNRAKLTALTWVRRTHPDVWQQALDDAWKDIRADEGHVAVRAEPVVTGVRVAVEHAEAMDGDRAGESTWRFAQVPGTRDDAGGGTSPSPV